MVRLAAVNLFLSPEDHEISNLKNIFDFETKNFIQPSLGSIILRVSSRIYSLIPWG